MHTLDRWETPLGDAPRAWRAFRFLRQVIAFSHSTDDRRTAHSCLTCGKTGENIQAVAGRIKPGLAGHSPRP